MEKHCQTVGGGTGVGGDGKGLPLVQIRNLKEESAMRSLSCCMES